MKNQINIILIVIFAASLSFSACSKDDSSGSSENNSTNVPVTSVTLNRDSTTIMFGRSKKLQAVIEPSNATNKNMTWRSGDETVATVSATGLVTAKAIGTTTITVTSEDGGFTDTCNVTVSSFLPAEVSATGVSMDITSALIIAGSTRQITAIIFPFNATNQTVFWSSANESVATVSSTGLVTAKAAGTTTVTVETEDGGFKDICIITVATASVYIPVTGVNLNKASTTILTGGTTQLTAAVLPSNATIKGVTWKSNNTGVATVSSTGLVTAKASGTALITVTTENGGFSDTCNVTVPSLLPSEVSVTDVALNKTSTTIGVGSGHSEQLVATITPSNATNKNVEWMSSNIDVATVSSNGLVTGRKAGTAVITVRTEDEGLTYTCSVTVVWNAGDKLTFSGAGVSFKMAYVPGGVTFPTETDNSGTAAVSDAYWICESEVTYLLYASVFFWSAPHYFLLLGGRGGYWDDDDTEFYGFPSGYESHPVTEITWRDAMVWCNALTEWYNAQNGTNYTCVYTYNGNVIRDAWTDPDHCDNVVASPTATGFRLLTSNEWELAARWRNDSTNTVIGYSNPWFTQGDSASGATANFNNAEENGIVAVYSGNYTYPVMYKTANSLGLYDMSGNAEEWCFDWHTSYIGSARVARGGYWHLGGDYLQIGRESAYNPGRTWGHFQTGFRIGRSNR